MLIILTVPALSNSAEIETAWQESINSSDESPNGVLSDENQNDDTQSDNEAEQPAEDQDGTSDDTSSGDQESTASAEGNVQFSDDETQQEESAPDNDESEFVGNDNSEKIQIIQTKN